MTTQIVIGCKDERERNLYHTARAFYLSVMGARFEYAMRYAEREYLYRMLDRYGTITHTARNMGISRKHLHTLIKKHGIVFKNGSVRS